MAQHIFFSWQSDTPNAVGRSLVEWALENAIDTLQADAEIDPANREIAIDKDTLNVPGSPSIAETIFGKIDLATAFVSDLTFVALRPKGGGIPNPNVLIEHGWALKSLSSRRVISVMNVALGHPDDHELPFDLRHVRRPIFYACPESATPEQKREARQGLSKALYTALKAILTDETARPSSNHDVPREPNPRDVELLTRVHNQLPEALRLFLHQHNFGTAFRIGQLDPIHEMNETWRGALYEFHDAEVQAAFKELRQKASAFGNLILECIFPIDSNPQMGWPKTDIDIRQGVQPTTTEAITRMNAMAAQLCEAIDGFDRVARDRIPIALNAARAPSVDHQRELAAAALQELVFDAGRGEVPQIVSKPRLTLRLVPFKATENRRLDIRRVIELLQRFAPSPELKFESNANGQQWWSNAPPRRVGDGLNPETWWLMRLVRPGYFEYQITTGRRVDDDPDTLVDGRLVEALIVSSLERMMAIATDLDLAGPALVTISLDGVEDVKLSDGGWAGRRIRRPDIFLPTAELTSMSLDLAAALHEQIDILWQSAGRLTGSPSFERGEWAGYSDEQSYFVDYRELACR